MKSTFSINHTEPQHTAFSLKEIKNPQRLKRQSPNVIHIKFWRVEISVVKGENWCVLQDEDDTRHVILLVDSYLKMRQLASQVRRVAQEASNALIATLRRTEQTIDKDKGTKILFVASSFSSSKKKRDRCWGLSNVSRQRLQRRRIDWLWCFFFWKGRKQKQTNKQTLP